MKKISPIRLENIKHLSIKKRMELIHIWFPDERLPMINYMSEKLIEFMTEKPDKLKKIVAGTWTKERESLELSNAVEVINSHMSELLRIRKFFSENLFQGYLACYTVYCIVQYANDNKDKNSSLFLAVNFLFEQDVEYINNPFR